VPELFSSPDIFVILKVTHYTMKIIMTFY